MSEARLLSSLFSLFGTTESSTPSLSVRASVNLSAIVVIIICEIRVGGWDGLIIKVTKNKVLWTTFDVKCSISFNDIISHVNRVPM